MLPAHLIHDLYDASIANKKEIQCTICLSSVDRDTLTVTLCGHKFHKNCIAIWEEKHKTCPECRTPVLKPPLRTTSALTEDYAMASTHSISASASTPASPTDGYDFSQLNHPCILFVDSSRRDSDYSRMFLDKYIANYQSRYSSIHVITSSLGLIPQNSPTFQTLTERSLNLNNYQGRTQYWFNLDTAARIRVIRSYIDQQRDLGTVPNARPMLLVIDLRFINLDTIRDRTYMEVLYNGKHYNITTILLTGSPSICPPVRAQADVVCIPRQDVLRNKEKLYQHYASNLVSYASFMRKLENTTRRRDKCMIIEQYPLHRINSYAI